MTVELSHEDDKDFAAWSNTGQVPAAEAVERLIRVLAETRKTMEPAFPETLPLLIKEPPQVDSAGWQWSMEADGSLVLNLRHPGLGWLGFRMRNVDLFHKNLANVLDQQNALQKEFGLPAA